MSEVTPWFPGKVKPVRVGVYETAPRGVTRYYQFWDGFRWGWAGHSPKEAEQDRRLPSYHQKDKWRGLSSDPSKEK